MEQKVRNAHKVAKELADEYRHDPAIWNTVYSSVFYSMMTSVPPQEGAQQPQS